ncbi:hypothetical protein [Butyrivibrio sp. MC2013]|uniref:hypothetical protein n=1 Tax=Butyrivibrio sp. MC2013 TaxID=1280686 RepID=UPI00047EDB13|nr:hypothetical protein [Butyrivibrio sp. MC2013]
MIDKSSIHEITNYLFQCDYFDDNFDPDGDEQHLDKAYELFQKFIWDDIIVEWNKYLFENCHTSDEVINYANLFIYYEAASKYNPEPYTFLGYLYAHVDLDKEWDKAGDLFDSIAIEMLGAQNLIDLMEDPYYSPLKDERILKSVDYWKNRQT